MKTMINIKVDRETKDKAKKTAERIGIPLSTIINAYLKQFTYTSEVYFSAPEGDLKPAARKRLAQLRQDARAGRNLSPRFDRAEDALLYLHS